LKILPYGGTNVLEMKLRDRVIVVTGGAHGIGRAMCLRFAQEQPEAIVVADLDIAMARDVAGKIDGIAVETDVGSDESIRNLVSTALETYGRIDVFCSNAGIGGTGGGIDVPNPEWQLFFEINVLAHVYAARAVIPSMLARSEGYLLQTVSAAGLLMQIGSAPYTVSKHAAMAFAEWLSVMYSDAGIRVSALCPQGVRTRMLGEAEPGARAFLHANALEPEDVAETVVAGIDAEKFLILPHPEVSEYVRRRGDDYERWLRGMRKLKEKLEDV
jgi:NAD(P)-dependent dehydrogenase (short-subunit alcohol dehydrogenase family)